MLYAKSFTISLQIQWSLTTTIIWLALPNFWWLATMEISVVFYQTLLPCPHAWKMSWLCDYTYYVHYMRLDLRKGYDNYIIIFDYVNSIISWQCGVFHQTLLHAPTRKQEAGLQGYIRIQYDHVLYVRGHIIQNVQPI